MRQDDLFKDKPAEHGRNPFWALIAILTTILIVCHLIEQVEAARTTFDDAEFWQRHIKFVTRDCRDLAFASLLVMVIWFLPIRFLGLIVVALGGLCWLENELIAKTRYGDFLRTQAWWQWETIDTCLTVILATVSMPILKWLTRKKKIFTRSMSIADILLLTFACALFLATLKSLGTMSGQIDSDRISEIVINSFSLSLIGLTIIYVSYFGRLFQGCFVYTCFFTYYMVSDKILDVQNSELKFKLENLTIAKAWLGEFDRYIAVYFLFLLVIVAARLVSRVLLKPTDADTSNSIDIGEGESLG